MVSTQATISASTRRGEGRCARCGKRRDCGFLTCSACLKHIRERDNINRKYPTRRNPDTADGWDDTLPMERPLETSTGGPTSYRPGSWDKVLLMAKRYADGLPLFRPDDAEGATAVETFNREQTDD